jgi:hypothetical protein
MGESALPNSYALRDIESAPSEYGAACIVRIYVVYTVVNMC